MIKAGIIGGAGYTAGELIRLLLNHPETEIVFINSSSNAGNRITDVHEGLYGETDLRFTDQLPLDEIDVLFFCTAHGDTKKFMESHNIPEDLKIIDLSMDYRIKSDDHDFIYGLPELNRRATCTRPAPASQKPDVDRRYFGKRHYRKYGCRRETGSYQSFQLEKQ